MWASAIRQLAAARNAPRVAAAFNEHTIQLWDLHTAELRSQFNTVFEFGGHRVALNPTGELCVAAAWSMESVVVLPVTMPSPAPEFGIEQIFAGLNVFASPVRAKVSGVE